MPYHFVDIATRSVSKSWRQAIALTTLTTIAYSCFNFLAWLFS
ncbi:MAG TPA: hypothetical protein VE944_12390 [Nostoc sp.]|nr:hypothetical protein [Nostoc sp.]HYX15142.1 hypothetical protein [Nostoc sp.]